MLAGLRRVTTRSVAWRGRIRVRGFMAAGLGALMVSLLLAGSAAFTRAVAQDGDDDAPPPTKGPAWAGVLFFKKDNDAAPYLVAESIDPTSPAQKAGLLAGDTIISFSGTPIRSVVANPSKFKPGEKVTVKLRRNGVREIPLTLGVRPNRWLSMHVGNEKAMVSINDLLATADVLPAFVNGAFGCNDLPIAGAQVTTLNADLASALKSTSPTGLLVLQVAPGTAATRAGIKGGDILVRADSTTLDSPLALAKAMRASKGREVTLTVQRSGETRSVKIQW